MRITCNPVGKHIGRKRRSGITLVEVLVAVSVIGLLLAILLPAINFARDSADRLSCRNKLGQIALAVQNYTDTFAVGPDPRTLPRRLASQLEYAIDPVGVSNPSAEIKTDPVWVCPSDSFDEALGAFSYVPSNGIGWWGKTSGLGSYLRLPLDEPRVLTPAAVSDGMSNTVLLSEIILTANNKGQSEWLQSGTVQSGAGTGSRTDRRLSVWETTARYIDLATGEIDPRELEALSTECGMSPGQLYESEWGDDFGHQSRRRLQFVASAWSDPGFNSINTPNIASCVPERILGFPEDSQVIGGPTYGSYAASSFHPGTVNAARFDGSVQSVSEEIDLAVWRALNSSSSGD